MLELTNKRESPLPLTLYHLPIKKTSIKLINKTKKQSIDLNEIQ
ncbi:hypothetical protein Xhom_02557 [Xenorhabdus hominickii]|uniref:Uncharacterized protein n=1 Tax=Xenorhabdus hominickii TaxID=351679 RepID=A0A2G0Q5Y6_XENHO|nr:hypothetical protein Xhom_02557 [Xenorhabdus hominickii]